MNKATVLTVRVQIGDADGPVVVVRGREAWALQRLLAAGELGCTPIDHPGPRWSGYVHDLRKFGFVIETVPERHGGNFPGNHARYVLRSRVVILDHGDKTGPASPANPSAIVRSADTAMKPAHDDEKRISGLP